VFLDELGNNLILALEFEFNRHDPAILKVSGPLLGALEGSSTVFEELPLPVVVERRSQVIPIAKIRD
jgi:hypothetical protein